MIQPSKPDTQEDSSYPGYKLLTSRARLPISLQF